MHGMMKRLFVLVAFVSSLSGATWQRALTIRAEAAQLAARSSGESGNPGGWMLDWLLCGPFQLQTLPNNTPDGVHMPGFEKDFLEGHGGESDPRVMAGQVESYDGGSARWVAHNGTGFSIDLDKALSDKAFVVGYAYREFEWPREETMVLALGTNDGGMAWLNGERIWDRPEARGMKIDDDQILVRLRRGRNRLLLKIEERGNKWEFCSRLLPFDATALGVSRPFHTIVNRADGSVAMRLLHPLSAIETLFPRLDLAVVRESEPNVVVWEGVWTRQQEMVLPITVGEYDKYRLRLNGIISSISRAWSAQTPFAAGRRVEHRLFAGGSSDYVIALGEGASESERWAAKELQYWLKEVSGIELPVRNLREARGEQVILVGFNQRTRELLGNGAAEPEAGDESFIYRNVGPTILIYGGSARGTLYGVMSFLERELGCRWYTPRVSLAPKRAGYSFMRLDHREAPGVRVRNDFYYEAFDPVWAARNRVNGAMSHREQPGGVEAYWGVHTFYRFVPPQEFFASHPEYFSLIDGKRTWDRAQLCLTNPAVLTIVTDRLRQTMREHPEYLIYCISQNDWLNPCQCDKCQSIAKREGTEAGPIVWFVNQVAAAVEKEFPGKYVGTLAYQYTRKPPLNERPRSNVVVRLCSIEACFAHDFENCPENRSFIEDLRSWAGIAPQLYIWDYVVNFSHYVMPFPNFRALQPNIQALTMNKAIGIMEQAAYQSRGGEFAELRSYLLAKLLWNPDGDVDETINDFLSGYYGRSGQHVRRYFDLLHGRLTAETHIHLGLRADDSIFSDQFVREADRIFDQAEAVADNDEVRGRVEMARLPLLYLKCQRTPVVAKYDGTYDRFRAIVAREGVTHFAESGKAQSDAFYQKMERAR